MKTPDQLREFVNGLGRTEIQVHLEARGFAVYDHEETETLREALYLDLEEEAHHPSREDGR